MKHFLVLKKINSQSGFNLLEVLLVTIIIGIATAIAAPSLVASRQDNEAKEVFTQIKGALVQAQAEANRISGNCGITISATQVTRSSTASTDCRIDSFNIDSDVVGIESNNGGIPATVNYDFEGDTVARTLLISRKNRNGTIFREVGRCIVIANNLGMIRTGVYDTTASSNCRNPENDRYDSFN